MVYKALHALSLVQSVSYPHLLYTSTLFLLTLFKQAGSLLWTSILYVWNALFPFFSPSFHGGFCSDVTLSEKLSLIPYSKYHPYLYPLALFFLTLLYFSSQLFFFFVEIIWTQLLPVSLPWTKAPYGRCFAHPCMSRADSYPWCMVAFD